MDDVIAKFKKLRLKNCALNLQEVMEQSMEKNLSPLQTIDRLLDIEIGCRERARIALRFKQSKLGEKTTIDQFDFTHHESRQKERNRILNLVDLEFIRDQKDIICIGNPGTTAVDMINQLVAAEQDHTLLKKLKYYQSQDLLICDEIGYLPLGKQGSNLFFQIISARHEKKSTIITTNLPFAKWGTIFDGTTVATAIADRLVYNSEILIMEGKSYRKR